MKLKKETTLFFLLFLLGGKIYSQAPNWQWATSISSTGDDEGLAIAIDDSGNVYTTGSFHGTVDFDPGVGTYNLTSFGSYDAYISKRDTYGNFLWAKQLGGTSGEWGHAISIAPSGVYTTGNYSGTADFDPGLGTFNLTSTPAGSINEMYISKLDVNGNFVFAKTMYSNYNCYSRSLTLDSLNNIYCTGSFVGMTDFDPGAGTFNLTSAGGGHDTFISKFDSLGNFIWAKQIGCNSEDRGVSLAIESTNNILITGFFKGTADFDPGAGVFNLTSMASYDSYITKLDSLGNFVWAKSFGGSTSDQGLSITTDASGNVYSTGYFEGSVDFDPGAGIFNLNASNRDVFILKLNNSGNFVWAKSMGGTGNNQGLSILVDLNGYVYTAGSFSQTTDFDPGASSYYLTSGALSDDLFVSKLDTSGNFVWAISANGTSTDYATAITVSSASDIYLTGYFSSPTLLFGSTTLTNAGVRDAFISKLNGYTGIEDIQNNNSISLYPNPTTDIFTISFEKNIKKAELNIFDITGKIIYATTVSNTQQTEVNTKEFSSGIYFVQIVSSDFVETRKLVVAK